jgi:hypothetical protein
VITYVPAFTVFLLIVIVKPGPSVPVSFPGAAAALGPANAKARHETASAAIVERMKVLLREVSRR